MGFPCVSLRLGAMFPIVFSPPSLWSSLGYQLLTLSRDHTLRVWPISDQLSSTLGAVPMETDGQETEPHSAVEPSLPSHMELLGTTTTDVQVNKQHIIRSIHTHFTHATLLHK